MGNSKSQQFNNLLSKFKSQDWNIIYQKQTFQIWQRKSDNRRFMSYPINETQIDSQQKLQLYNFRKLNHGNIVAIDTILSNQDQFLCSLPKNKHVLVENIPFRLVSFNQTFNLFDGLTILSATFAGYNTLNYVYGPLFTNQQMIGFTESGVPKVWVNQNLSINEPSKLAIYGGDEATPTSIEQRTYCCVQKIFDIVQIAINGGYPSDFRAQASQTTTFAEGEELVQNYCRRRGINLEDRVALNRTIHVEPLYFRSETHLRSSRPSLNAYIRTNPYIQGSKPEISTNYIKTQVSSQHPTINIQSQQTPSQSIVLCKPFPRTSINSNTKINFVFNNVNLDNNSIVVVAQKQEFGSKQPKQCFPVQARQQLPIKSSQPEVNPPIQCTTQQSNFHLQQKMGHFHSQRPHINTVQSKQQILIHTPKVAQQSQSQSEQQYQLVVHEITQNDEQEVIHQQPPQILVQNNRLPTSESVEEQGLTQSIEESSQPFDQLKKWEQSLMKLSERQKQNYEQKLVTKNKPFYSSQQQQYLSQERDKVHIQPTNHVQEFTNLNELESYIRNKYKEYLTSPEPYSQLNYSHPIRQSQAQYQYDSNKYFNYAEEYTQNIQPLPLQQNQENYQNPKYKIRQEDSDQRKYTFGKIQLDPISANNQYNTAKQRQRRPSAFQPLKTKETKKYQQNSIEDKYSKYVKNREPRTNVIQSKDISSIMRVEDSVFNTNKKDYLLNEYLQQSFKQIEKPKAKSQKDNGITYDKLRELLWA